MTILNYSPFDLKLRKSNPEIWTIVEVARMVLNSFSNARLGCLVKGFGLHTVVVVD
jgi:hypothetical protein